MSLQTRKHKINQIAVQSLRQVFDNRKGRKTYQLDSVRTGKPYQLVVNQSKNGVLRYRCELYTYDHKEQVNERGNHRVDYCRTTVGYQALGKLKAAARAKGKILSLCNDKAGAVKLLNFGGELVKITNLGGGTVWGTAR